MITTGIEIAVLVILALVALACATLGFVMLTAHRSDRPPRSKAEWKGPFR